MFSETFGVTVFSAAVYFLRAPIAVGPPPTDQYTVAVMLEVMSLLMLMGLGFLLVDI